MYAMRSMQIVYVAYMEIQMTYFCQNTYFWPTSAKMYKHEVIFFLVHLNEL